MATSTVNLNISKTAEAGGEAEGIIMPTATNSSAPDNKTVQAFSSSTFAAVSVPATATGVYIVPPSANTYSITLKGVTGDTGVALNLTQPSFISIIGGTTAFGLLCGGAITVEFIWT